MSRQTLMLATMALIAGSASAQQNIPAAFSNDDPDRVIDGQSATAATAAESPEPETDLARLIRDAESLQRTPATARVESGYTTEQVAAYNEWVLTYTQDAYAWHHLSTVIIFFVVISVVLSGVVLAAWQLRSWLRRVAAYDKVFLGRLEQGHEVSAALIAETGKAGSNELNLQSKAVALTTPYVGVVILGLSMGFFLAYLLLVYPILQGP